jgi:hypothetical protein
MRILKRPPVTDSMEHVIFESMFCSIIAYLCILIFFGSSPYTAAALIALALACYFTLRFFMYRATVQDINDAERKQAFIAHFTKCFYPLSAFLTRYHPDWYPPPIQRRLSFAIATYATFFRDLDRANGKPPSTEPDYVLIGSFRDTRAIFPAAWNYETTTHFCQPISGILDMFSISAGLTLAENIQYSNVLTAFFEAKTDTAKEKAENQFPPELVEKTNRVFDALRSLPKTTDTITAEIERCAERLTALIPEYIAQIRVVIGSVPNDVPMIYREDERFQHTYIIGKTGSGKSTLLRNLITQDIHHGNGIIVLSPENGLFEDLLKYVPESRKNDLIYFDPTDIQPPVIGFNPLILEKGEDLEAKAGETMTIFKRALGDLGVTMEPLIRNAVYALLQCPNSTITDIYHLIDPDNRTLRRTIANTGTVDDITRKFWIDYDKSTYYQKSFMPVVNRLSIFFRPPLSLILSTPALSFKDEMNKASRLIFLNLSRLRDLQQQSTGQLILAQIQQALLSRDEIPEQHRIPYYLYIDEFQTYAADSEGSLIKLFNGARKFRLAVTIAHQTTADIPAKLLSAIVGNVGTVACRQLAAEDAPFFARQLQIKRSGSEAAAPEVLQNLTRADAYVATPSQQIGVRITVPKDPLVSRPVSIPKQELTTLSKRNYGLIPDIEPAAADEDTPQEHVEEPLDTAAPQPPPAPRAERPKAKAPETPTPQPKPKSPPRRKRNRFDEDVGDPEIEIR